MSHQNGSSDKRTVVDEGTSFKGTLSSSCPIDVHGQIEGDVDTPSLNISATGSVHGRVKVGSVCSEGEIAGEFEAQSVELAGCVKDNTVIRARSLEVKLSSDRGRLQVIFGECELSVGDEPTEHVELPVEAEQVAVAEDASAAEGAAEAPVAASTNVLTDSDFMETKGEDAGSVAAPNADSSGLADETETNDEEEAVIAGPADATDPKPRRRRKGKSGGSDDAPYVGWSQPPSQPPPTS